MSKCRNILPNQLVSHKRSKIVRLGPLKTEALQGLLLICGGSLLFEVYMSGHPLSFMFEALTRLESAVESAAQSINASKVQDKAILARIASYREIIKRQHTLIKDIERASAREDWKEVSRITNLVHGSSLMIKVDAGFLISGMRNKGTSATKSH